jgi:predicted ATPase
MSDTDINHFLIIGAYRDNEVDDVHPLTGVLRNIEKSNHITHISLGALSVENIACLITDSLRCNLIDALPLAKLVSYKTEGNPFFIKLFLTNLVREQLVHYENTTGTWIWDLKKIETMEITHNVIDMVICRIRRLPSDTQKLLALAACIGSRFDLDALSLIYESPIIRTFKVLRPAINDGLVLKVLGSDIEYMDSNEEMSQQFVVFQFLHDRVLQISHEQLNTNDLRIAHLKIGRLLLERMTQTTHDELLFDVVEHFKQASSLLDDPVECLQVAQLAYTAGERAKISSAFDPAASFFKFGIELLPEKDAWTEHYELTFKLYCNFAEAEYLRGSPEVSEKLYPLILEQSRTDLDRIKVYRIQLFQLEAQQRFRETIITTYKCLDTMGIFLPEIDTPEDELQYFLEQESQDISYNLRDRQYSDLIYEPKMKHESDIIIMDLLSGMWAPLYASGLFTIMSFVVAKMTNFSLVNGICRSSGIGYLNYSLAAVTHGRQDHWKFGEVGLQLAYKYDNIPLRCKCLLAFGLMIGHVQPVANAVTYFQKCFDNAMECGDTSYASYSSHHIITESFASGIELQQVAKLYDKYMSYLKKNNTFIWKYAVNVTQPLRFLLAMEDVNVMDEDSANTSGILLFIGSFYYGKTITAYWKDEKENRLHYASRAYQYCITSLRQTYQLLEIQFFVALSFLSACGDASINLSDSDRVYYLSTVEDIMIKLHNWAEMCEANMLHKLYLVQAEKARVENKTLDALEYYEKAIESAQKHEFIQYQALANELCAKMWLSLDKMKYAKTHLHEAFYLYGSYGAIGKIVQLKRQYPELTALSDSSNDNSLTNNNSIPQEEYLSGTPLDLTTVMKASQAISSETTLDVFLDKMMKLIIENAGAQNGIFILAENDGKLLVVAEGDINKVVVDTIRAVPLQSWNKCPRSIVNFVIRTKETVVLKDCSSMRHPFESDPFFQHNIVRSVLCMPCIKQDVCKGVLYLENNATNNAFNEQRTSILGYLASHMALSLENARFSALLESEKRYRSLAAELESRKKRLEEFIDVLCK